MIHLYNPAFWQYLKARWNGWWFLVWPNPNAFDTGPPMLDDLDIPLGQMLGRPRPKAAVVPTIGSQLADVWVAFGHPCQQERRPIPIADVCGVGLECQHQPLSIDQQVTFAVIDLLATIKATLRTADIGCFDRLAVDDRRTRCRLRPSA
jgi:hypothetical protein